ncbi:MAG: XRE family transcriptional regulator [Cellulomonadaceae bacterium]|jgi:predicted nucleotidyltransferase/DNA-binding XRE family transcriptional regulator|nr:XRE family transcriptional regulator [Cellulomonadaceae bacterium]
MDGELRKVRQAAGLTQAQLAGLSGVASSNISAYESGTRPLTPRMRERLLASMRRPSDILRARRKDVAAIMAEANLTNVRVFGSVAAGADTPASDIDFLYDVGPAATMLTVVKARQRLEELLGFSVDMVSARAVPERKREILTTAVAL